MRYDFVTDLIGIALAIPEIAWAKPAKTKGRFSVQGALSAPPTVEALSLDGPGLSAEGGLTLGAEGAFERLTMTSYNFV